MKIRKDHVTVICEDGWKYAGYKEAEKFSPFGSLEWISIETKNGLVRINAKYIVAIMTSKSNEYRIKDREKN